MFLLLNLPNSEKPETMMSTNAYSEAMIKLIKTKSIKTASFMVIHEILILY